MEKYIPDIYQKSIYKINYDLLKERGIKCLLFDLDNTLVPYNSDVITKKIISFMGNLREMGFKLIIFTNRSRKRAENFKSVLHVDCCANAKKPLKSNFIKVIEHYDFKICEVAIIGDQLHTDILGGNKVGITTILVNPISIHDHFATRLLRIRENMIYKKMKRKGIFTKEKYYE